MSMHHDTVTIRRAAPADAAAVERLALLDGAPRPLSGPVLLAEAGGAARAALALADGRAVSDPFHPTADLVALLRMRAALPAGTRRRGMRRHGPSRAFGSRAGEPLARRLPLLLARRSHGRVASSNQLG
jgi:hypothetical protein